MGMGWNRARVCDRGGLAVEGASKYTYEALIHIHIIRRERGLRVAWKSINSTRPAQSISHHVGFEHGRHFALATTTIASVVIPSLPRVISAFVGDHAACLASQPASQTGHQSID